MDEVDEAAQLIATTRDGEYRIIQTDESLETVLREAERHAWDMGPTVSRWDLVQQTYNQIRSWERLKEEAPDFWNEVMIQ